MRMGIDAAGHDGLSSGIDHCGVSRFRAGKTGHDFAVLYENVLDLSIYGIQRVEDVAVPDNHHISWIRLNCIRLDRIRRHQTTSLGSSQIASAGQIMPQVAHEPQTSWFTTLTEPFRTSRRGFSSISFRWPAAR